MGIKLLLLYVEDDDEDEDEEEEEEEGVEEIGKVEGKGEECDTLY